MNTTPIASPGLPLAMPQSIGGETTQAREGFGEILINTINQVQQAELRGDRAIQKLQTGEARNLHEVMIATEEADMALRMLVQMRNKALEAYNEVMRLQV
jgi:flagellar hook-basal body complex protein FliE